MKGCGSKEPRLIRVGGISPAATSVISGNGWGVTITDVGATANVVQGNLIGTGVDGLTPLGNEIDGVLVTNGARTI